MTFDFVQGDAGGILTVTGDDGPNMIAIFQPRDRVVEVVGDGQRRTFEDVDEIFIAAGGGNDEIRSSKPKEIVVVGSKININAGAGNDLVQIDDGGETRKPVIWNAAMDFAVDLGIGADELVMKTHHHDQIELDLTSGDGGDRILIGMLLPAVQKVREAAARVSLDLAGSNNQGRVSNQGFGKWEVSLATRDTAEPSEPQQFLFIAKMQAARNSRSTPTGTVTFVIDGNPQATPGSDRLRLTANGYDESELELRAGAGDDVIHISERAGPFFSFLSSRLRHTVDLGEGHDLVTISTHGFANDSLTLTAGEGNDTVATDSFYGTGIYKSTDGGKTWNVDLGDGNDTLLQKAVGHAVVKSSIDAGDGDDTIVSSSSPPSPSAQPLPVLLVIADQHDFYLGAGNDRLVLDSSGYQEAHALVDAGEGDDTVHVRHRMFAIIDRTNVTSTFLLGAGNDTLSIQALSFDKIRVQIDTGPAGDGRDLVTASFQNTPQERVRRMRRAADGGLDHFELAVGVGYDTQMTTGDQSLIVIFTRS